MNDFKQDKNNGDIDETILFTNCEGDKRRIASAEFISGHVGFSVFDEKGTRLASFSVENVNRKKMLKFFKKTLE